MTNKEQSAIFLQKIIRGHQSRKVIRGPLFKKQFMKQNFTHEILETERTYFKQLDAMFNDYLVPLLQKKLSSEQTLYAIFSNIELLRNLHASLLEALEERFVSNFFTFGDLFTEFVPFLILYTDFVNNFDTSREAITKEKKQNKAFEDFISQPERKKNCKLDIHSLLITPVQRIPRYIMLFEGLLKYLDKTNLDYEVFKTVLSKLKILAVQVNKNKYKKQTFQALVLVQSKFRLLEGATLLKAGRKLLKEGHLIEKTHPNPSKSWVFLFNDCVIFATNDGDTFRFRFALPLSKITLRRDTGHQVERTSKQFLNFLLVKQIGAVTLTPDTQEDRDDWTTQIEEAITEVKKAQEVVHDLVKWERIGINRKKIKPPELHSHSSCVIEENMFIFGGEDSEGNLTNDIFSFDLGSKEWQKIKVNKGNIPEPRSGSTLTAVSAYLFLFGGENKTQKFGDFHIFITETGEWMNNPQTTGNRPTPRTGHTAALVGTQLWIFGGKNSEGVELNDLYCLDCNTYTWYDVKPEKNFLPPPRAFQSIQIVDYQIYIFGGKCKETVYNDIWAYDIEANEWYQPEIKGTKPEGRYGHSCCYVSQSKRIYYIGGNSQEEKPINDILSLHLNTSSWEQINEEGHTPDTRTFHNAVHYLEKESNDIEQEQDELGDLGIDNSDEKLPELRKNTIILFGGQGVDKFSNDAFSVDLDFKKSGKRRMEEEEEDLLFIKKKNDKQKDKNEKVNKGSNYQEDSTSKYDHSNYQKNGLNGNRIDENLQKSSNQLLADPHQRFNGYVQGKKSLNKLESMAKKFKIFDDKVRSIELDWRKKHRGESFKSSSSPKSQNQRKNTRTNSNSSVGSSSGGGGGGSGYSGNGNTGGKTTPIKPKTKPTPNNTPKTTPKNKRNINKIEQKQQNNFLNELNNRLPLKKVNTNSPNSNKNLNNHKNFNSNKTTNNNNINNNNVGKFGLKSNSNFKQLTGDIQKTKLQLQKSEKESTELQNKLENLKTTLSNLQKRRNYLSLFCGLEEFIPIKIYRKTSVVGVKMIKPPSLIGDIKVPFEKEFKKMVSFSFKKSPKKKINQEQYENYLSTYNKQERMPLKLIIHLGKKLK
ncbi:faciogenital dysplasia protein [Anaeramoeba flamelloides]|uniref:Faciogenital dysplasia protein n=1 Tax=Anaeramoeba flamelloides TaxID=1746091 RepID=A0ABQ8X5B4_9EUKA|nr:faciogenital dysplasia protein [Anaeramoeba flamelloides]